MKEEFDNKPFCILPFIHLATHPIGTVTPCCITDMENDMSTAKKDGFNLFLDKDKLDNITNSNNFNEVRRKMINGEFPSECKTCYFHENNKIYSKRMESNLKFKDYIEFAKSNTNEDGSLKKIAYNYIELRLGSVCNLKCITCNPFSSSKWNEDVSIFKDTEFEKNYFKCDIRTEWFRSQNFYDDLLEHCDDLQEIWINGGEPTLIKEHTYFLEKLINNGISKNISIQYSLNVTLIPDNLLELLKNFKKVTISLSIDDLYERNEYIRTGSKWETIFENFLKIIKYTNIFRIEVCQTVSALNVYNIDNFKHFFNDYNIVFTHNYVHHPSFLHVSVIPDDMKKEITDNIKYLNEYEKNRLISELNNNTNEQEKFNKYINLLDKQRGTKMSDKLKEWKKYE